MIIRILGSAAGGGFPQWNCNCKNCAAARAGDSRVVARTQTSIAVSADETRWTILDTSPDLRQQLIASPALQPGDSDPRRSSPIGAVIVTGFEIDQIGGLLNLREGQPFALYATPYVLASLRESAVFNVLPESTVARRSLQPGRPFEPFADARIDIEPIAVPGKIPFHQAIGRRAPLPGDETIGLIVRDSATGKSAAYIPSCAAVTGDLLSQLHGVDVLLFDGTLFNDLELVEQGLSTKTGTMMGHVPMSGPDGAIERLRSAQIPRRIFIHLNNSNPVLRGDSRERRFVTEAGWDIAYDGMEFRL